MKNGGALPSQLIGKLIEEEFITGAAPESIRPASLDLRLTDEVYRVNGAFLPTCEETVYDAIKRVGGIKLPGEKVLLERGVCYAIKLAESIARLPDKVYGYCNPKSSSGRVDVHVRLLVDFLPRYDAVGKHYAGPLWLLVVPKSFSVIVSPGLSLNQMRLFNADTRFDELYLEMMFGAHGGLLFDSKGEGIRYHDLKQSDGDGSILLTLGLDFPRPGFVAEETAEPIDLLLKGHHDPRFFFREIDLRKNSIALKSGAFYILSTGGYVRVPPEFACEMRPMDERSGDLRSHYAGFIDPGWGMNGAGRPLTLEVRSFDNALVVRHGQPIAKIRYECVAGKPEQHYDEMAPTYGTQIGPVLAKYFSEWK